MIDTAWQTDAPASEYTEVLVRDLTVCFRTDRGEELPAVAHADLTLPAGKITGLVGESGRASPPSRSRCSAPCPRRAGSPRAPCT